MNYIKNLNQRTPIYFQNSSPTITQYIPSQIYQRPVFSNQFYNSFQTPYHHHSVNLNNINQNSYSKLYPSYQRPQSYIGSIQGSKNIYSSSQKVNSSADRKYLNSNIKSNKYNTSERISQQPEYLQSSTKRISQNYQQFNNQNNQKINSIYSESFKYEQKKDDSFQNVNIRPDPTYCVLCERYYEFQQEKQHLQKHRKVKSHQKTKDTKKQLNQKVSKFQRKIPISVPSEFVITQNVCKVDFNRNKKDVEVNTSERDFTQNQNSKLQTKLKFIEPKQFVNEGQFFMIEQQKKSLSNKSMPKKIVENINLKQNQSNTQQVQQLKKSHIKNNAQEVIQICPSQYQISDRNFISQYAKKKINMSENKNEKEIIQNKISTELKQQESLQDKLKNDLKGEYGSKPTIKMPLSKIQRPIYNQSMYQESQQMIQIQPTQLNFQQLSLRNSKKAHKSQKNYGNKQYEININLSERKPSSQINKQLSEQLLKSNSQKGRSGSIHQGQVSKQNHQELDQKGVFKKKKIQEKNQPIYQGIKQIDNIQIQSNKNKIKNAIQNQNLKKSAISKNDSNSIKNSFSRGKRHVQLIDIGVGDSPVDLQSPGLSSHVKSGSSKKQKKAKNMLINQPF